MATNCLTLPGRLRLSDQSSLGHVWKAGPQEEGIQGLRAPSRSACAPAGGTKREDQNRMRVAGESSVKGLRSNLRRQVPSFKRRDEAGEANRETANLGTEVL